MDEARLRQVLAAHQEWLSSGKNKGKQAALAREDLRFADLSEVNLTESILTEANLERTALKGAQLDRADLRGANLMYADAGGARLAHANLAGSRLDGIRLDQANLTEAKLGGATLEHASLRQATLAGASAANAKLAHTDLTLADLDRCVLSGADLTGATLAHASLRGASADRVKLVRATLTGADIEGASMRGADLTDAVLISVRLTTAILDGAKVDPSWDGAPTHEEPSDGKDESEQSHLQHLTAGGEQRARLAIVSRQLEQVRLAFRRSAEGSAQSTTLSARMIELEDERKILAQDVQRAEQEASRIQADFAARIAAAVTALRVPSGRGSAALQRLRIWGMTLKTLALGCFVIAGAALASTRVSWRPQLNDTSIAGVPVAVVLLLLTAAGLLWLDAQNSRHVTRQLLRKARIEEAAAVLQASQFVSLDVARTQHVVDRTFAMVREAMVGPLNRGHHAGEQEEL